MKSALRTFKYAQERHVKMALYFKAASFSVSWKDLLIVEWRQAQFKPGNTHSFPGNWWSREVFSFGVRTAFAQQSVSTTFKKSVERVGLYKTQRHLTTRRKHSDPAPAAAHRHRAPLIRRLLRPRPRCGPPSPGPSYPASPRPTSAGWPDGCPTPAPSSPRSSAKQETESTQRDQRLPLHPQPSPLEVQCGGLVGQNQLNTSLNPPLVKKQIVNVPPETFETTAPQM